MAAPRRVMPPPPLAAGGAKQRGRDPRGGAVAGHRRVPQVRRGRARASQGPRAGEHRSPPVSGPAGQASAVTARLPCRHRAAGLCVAYCLGPLPDLLDHDACPSIPPGRLRHAHVPLASRPAYALTRVTRVARLTRRLSAATCASASSSPTRPPPPGCPRPPTATVSRRARDREGAASVWHGWARTRHGPHPLGGRQGCRLHSAGDGRHGARTLSAGRVHGAAERAYRCAQCAHAPRDLSAPERP